MNQGNQGRYGSQDRDPHGQASSGTSSPGGGHGVRHKGGDSGYADVSDLGRGGGHAGGGGSGIDYGAAMNRGNQDFARDRGGESPSFAGPKNDARSDERIREDLCDRLQHLASRGHLDPSDIEVTVRDGEVTLDGTVPQRDWKHRAEDLAEAVIGVKGVENRIRVLRGEGSSAAPDEPAKSARDGDGDARSPSGSSPRSGAGGSTHAKS
jgi:hypothetical protein